MDMYLKDELGKAIKRLKTDHPELTYRYNYMFEGEPRFVFRNKDYSHYEFNALGDLVAFEE